MLVFLRCVAEAVAAKGVRGLMEMVPGGGFIHDVAEDAWKRMRERRQANEMREEVLRLAIASRADAQAAASQAAAEAGLTGAEALQLSQYLAHVPQTARQSLKRPEDPSGRSLAAGFVLRGADDVERLLPQAAPRFSPGDSPPALRGWMLEELLGVGGFGEVWRARHPSFANLRSAIKFARELSAGDRALLHEGNVLNRVMGEARHPGIVPLIDAGLDGGDLPWLRFEYVEGGDLADVVRAWQSLAVPDRGRHVRACLRELAGTVGHFHRLDPPIVHRDLKPSNILLDRSLPRSRLPAGLDFLPRVADFGIGGLGASRILEEERRGMTTRGGRLASYLRGSYTPLYASPQQRDGCDPDPRDDVHALGVIGYQLLTGNLQAGAGPDFAEELRELGADEGIIKVLARCVAQRAERRWSHAAALADALDEAPREAPRQAPRPILDAVPVEPPRPSKEELARQAESDFNRGEDFRLGRGVAVDFAEAARWLQRAAEAGHAFAQNNLATLYEYGRGVPRNHMEAARWYRKSADQSVAWAQNNLGWLYHNGWGVPQNYTEALRWYRLSAAQGNAFAQGNLGCLSRDGLGVPQDYVEAMKWYRLAAAQGDAASQACLGGLYEKGLGVPRNLTEAARWYRLAAEQNNSPSQYNLGMFYQHGIGVPRDCAEAMRLYRKAADQGHADAQCNIGWLYRDGLGVPRDYVEAMKWYRLSAGQNNSYAQNNLGALYQNGWGVPQNHMEAARWYRKAADQGYAEAQNNLAWLYHNGWGVPQNYAEARAWYQKAADQGHAGAQCNIGWLYRDGLGVPKDNTAAAKWYRLSAEQNNAYAQANMGWLCENGLGVSRNVKEAILWYQKAAFQNHREAADALRRLGVA
jgi:TPR repeat protein